MKIAERTIQAIGRIVTGDEGLSPYRSGPKLVSLFNDYGFDDVYPSGGGFLSRWQYAEDRLRDLNDTEALGALICHVLDPREFMDFEELNLDEAVEYVNKRLRYDDFEVAIERGRAKVRDLTGAMVKCAHPFGGSEDEAERFIDEQIKKCEAKIRDGDYDGAVTNARSLLEAVLREIEKQLDPEPPNPDGDLAKLYKRVQKLLNLEPGKPGLDNSLKQVLAGLSGIVHGLAGVSNRLGDRHVRSYKPAKHHAVLAVNAAKTVVGFLYDTQHYQGPTAKSPRPCSDA